MLVGEIPATYNNFGRDISQQIRKSGRKSPIFVIPLVLTLVGSGQYRPLKGLKRIPVPLGTWWKNKRRPKSRKKNRRLVTAKISGKISKEREKKIVKKSGRFLLVRGDGSTQVEGW